METTEQLLDRLERLKTDERTAKKDIEKAKVNIKKADKAYENATAARGKAGADRVNLKIVLENLERGLARVLQRKAKCLVDLEKRGEE